ncbi:MAG TPA: HAD-IC family P-type ATPase, partial [Patescibacteria group bacterium]
MAADVIQNLGLSSQEAANRLKIYGENITEKEKKNKVLPILWSQFNNPLTVILIIVTAVSYFLGDKINSTVIGIMLLVNATVGFWQEYKAYKSIEKLKKLINFKSKVIRNGKNVEIDTRLLVPGDIVLLHKGDKIPADIKVYKSLSATVNEANLTGESVPVEKETGDGLFAGTLMESGYCEGEVVKTGKDTELG